MKGSAPCTSQVVLDIWRESFGSRVDVGLGWFGIGLFGLDSCRSTYGPTKCANLSPRHGLVQSTRWSDVVLVYLTRLLSRSDSLRCSKPSVHYSRTNG
jgi:hypothetical protein